MPRSVACADGRTGGGEAGKVIYTLARSRGMGKMMVLFHYFPRQAFWTE